MSAEFRYPDGTPRTLAILRAVEDGRAPALEPGDRSRLHRRGWAWYAPGNGPDQMVLTRRGRAVLVARRDEA